jgi:4a-hydroxytetrahydrobiopterin dehydratase
VELLRLLAGSNLMFLGPLQPEEGQVEVVVGLWRYCIVINLIFTFMTATLLPASEIEQLENLLPDWEFLDGKLKRQWRFNDFPQAFAFMVRVAFIAETMGHHPNWSNSWNLVTIELITHDLGGLTNLDIKLAQQINCCV